MFLPPLIAAAIPGANDGNAGENFVYRQAARFRDTVGDIGEVIADAAGANISSGQSAEDQRNRFILVGGTAIIVGLSVYFIARK